MPTPRTTSRSSRFATPATADDVAAYYQTMLTAAGYELGVDESQAEQRHLEFDTPGSVYADASVDVSIDTSDDDVVVELEITDHADAEVLQAFSGWPAGMPTIGEGQPVEAWVTATRGPGTTLNVSTTFAYDDVTADELTSMVRDAATAGTGGFHLAEGDQGGATILLDHSVIESPSAEVSTAGTDAGEMTTLEMSGSLTL